MKRLIPLLPLLAGCVDPELLMRQQRAADHAACVDYGFRPGTDAYANCRMQVDQRREERSFQEDLARQAESAEQQRRLARSLRGNGQCDDGRYRTSNGGRAEPFGDEEDCRRYGDGLK
ncbi:MAG TPA: hypothetical protein VEH84_17470 [Alphaproteobacteria bacterium]|nr:hypothetical protein [Alphaproteobacteria bacterium]